MSLTKLVAQNPLVMGSKKQKIPLKMVVQAKAPQTLTAQAMASAENFPFQQRPIFAKSALIGQPLSDRSSGHGGCTSFLFGENFEVASLRETPESIKIDVENCLKNLSKGLCFSCANKPLGCKPNPLQRRAIQPKVQIKRHFSRAKKGKAKVGSVTLIS
jgi:hypothetical protein